MQPTIPFEFSPSALDVEEHLIYKPLEGGVQVSWPLVGAKFKQREKSKEIGLLEGLELDNPLFKMHGYSGFSVGSYHEFVVGDLGPCWGYKMGRVEVTIGAATPLAAYVFDPFYREKWFGDWDLLQSIRIIGAAMEDAELAYANAAIRYAEQFHRTPRLMDFGDLDFLWSEEEEAPEPDITVGPPMISQIEPLRFFLSGSSNPDATSRCIAFYRVIEYFSFFANQKDFSQLRHDQNVSDGVFVKKVVELVTKDEKGPILKLVNLLADGELIARAAERGLLGENGSANLGEELYKFRNSIVHGKQSFGYELFSPSLFHDDTSSDKWQGILRELAHAALQAYGVHKA
ncbi:hypothetical protein [Hephaestia mangrovi]|uniref:hypothetical protein n=1 Tax=Hephaestia mangrovi TaxID=2873268 RepID=UPI001CA765BE|nr:hypothetical protein [Hephaestia mangrovi]MBY8828937.1 hypothetical protein [Hephaestia mangrovi]